MYKIQPTWYREVLWEWNDKIANEHLTSLVSIPPLGHYKLQFSGSPLRKTGIHTKENKMKNFTYTVCILYTYSAYIVLLPHMQCVMLEETIIWFRGGNWQSSSIPLIMSLCCHIDRFSTGLNPRLLLKKRTPVTCHRNKEHIQQFSLQRNSRKVLSKN